MKLYLLTAVIALSGIAALPEGASAARRVSHRHPPVAHAHAHVHAARWAGETGTASYYGSAFQGRRAADGSRFNQHALTAAHPWLPFGTRVKVSLSATGRSVVVTITDRMRKPGRIVDLSTAAARRLGMTHRGLAEVRLLPA